MDTERLVRETDKNMRIIVSERDGEIITLSSAITTMKADWENLNAGYSLLDSEIKKQLCCNDELRGVIKNLVSNNHNHNDYINGYEEEMKKIFENFVRQALKKKTVEFIDPSEKVKKCEENYMECKLKISKMQLDKPNESSSFSTVDNTMKSIQGGHTTFTDIKLPRVSNK
jgi:hypothetical protein